MNTTDNEMEPIDDYIEHQLVIQAKANEIHKLTLKKDFAGAFEALCEMQAAGYKLENWLLRNMNY